MGWDKQTNKQTQQYHDSDGPKDRAEWKPEVTSYMSLSYLIYLQQIIHIIMKWNGSDITKRLLYIIMKWNLSDLLFLWRNSMPYRKTKFFRFWYRLDFISFFMCLVKLRKCMHWTDRKTCTQPLGNCILCR